MKRLVKTSIFAVLLSLFISGVACAEEIENTALNEEVIINENVEEIEVFEDGIIPATKEQIIGTWEGTLYNKYAETENKEFKALLRIDGYDYSLDKFKGCLMLSGDDVECIYDVTINWDPDDTLLYIRKDTIFESTYIYLYPFNAVIDKDKIKPQDEDDPVLLNLTKKSDTPLNRIQNYEDVNIGWTGYYMGHFHSGSGNIDVDVKRNYRFYFSKVERGAIEGVAIFTPSPEEIEYYGATGSYKFKGILNPQNGLVTIQGYAWVEAPDKWTTQEWRFVELKGVLNNEKKVIIGTTPNGEWIMNADITTPFIDIKPNTWYYTPVGWAVSNGITSGTSETTFSPNANCTRAQVVTFLWNVTGREKPTIQTSRFEDVQDPSKYYYNAVKWADEKGITSGKTKNRFAPDDIVTRAEFVTFLYKIKGSVPSTDKCSFTDVPKGKYYYTPVIWAFENNVTKGKSETLFDPNGICSRAQVVTFLYSAFK